MNENGGEQLICQMDVVKYIIPPHEYRWIQYNCALHTEQEFTGSNNIGRGNKIWRQHVNFNIMEIILKLGYHFMTNLIRAYEFQIRHDKTKEFSWDSSKHIVFQKPL